MKTITIIHLSLNNLRIKHYNSNLFKFRYPLANEKIFQHIVVNKHIIHTDMIIHSLHESRKTKTGDVKQLQFNNR